MLLKKYSHAGIKWHSFIMLLPPDKFTTQTFLTPASSACVVYLWYRTEADDRDYRALLQSTQTRQYVESVCLHAAHLQSWAATREERRTAQIKKSLFTVLRNAVVVWDPSLWIHMYKDTLGSNPTGAWSLSCFHTSVSTKSKHWGQKKTTTEKACSCHSSHLHTSWGFSNRLVWPDFYPQSLSDMNVLLELKS